MSTPQPAPLDRTRVRLVLLLCFSVFCSVLNGTMFNVAVPDIAAQFRLSAARVSWVVTGYIAVFAVAATTYGKLADLYPVRRLMSVGLLLFNLGALLSLLANWYPQLVAGRLVQAAGGGAIPALVMIIATRYAPPEERGRVLGAVAATVAFGMGLGPLVGGLLAGSLHWRWLFLLSFATLPVIPAIRRQLPDEARRPGRFDLGGALLLSAAIILLLLAMTRHQFWPLLAALATGAVLQRHLRRSAAPFIPPQLLSNRAYRRGLMIVFLAIGSVFGLLFIMPLLLRQLHGLGTLAIGLTIFPGALAAALVGLVGGRITDRLGAGPTARAGHLLLFAGYLLLVLWPDAGVVLVAALLLLCYAGFALLQPALGKAVSLTLPAGQAGVGMGLYNLVYFLSGAAGTALVGGLASGLRGLAPGGLDPASFPYRVIFALCALAVALALPLLASALQPAD